MAEFHKNSDFFTAFRTEYGFPNFARDEPLDWFREVGMWGVGISYVTVVLSITVIIAFLGTRGYSRWRVTLQMIISLGIGFSIVVCVSGIGWQVADYESTTEDHMSNDTLRYKLRIGLHQANITMARMSPPSTEYKEFHNVKIGWTEVFQAETEYREALMRGWPLGILKMARYISVDMGEMRYMRAFRWSGYAVWILLWTAFAAWLLANVLMGSNVSYAASFLLLTGILQVLACIVYDRQKPGNFYIPMDDGHGTNLRLRYDWMFWLTLFMGIFVMVMAAIILVLDYLKPADMNKFFGTTAEFHSPYDDNELVQNQNKDIKVMIRNLSQKRTRDGRKQSTANVDVEVSRKMPFHPYGSNGHDNPTFAKSMEIIDEGSDHSVERKDGTVPGINVEMVNIRSSDEEGKPNNNDLNVEKNTCPDGDSENEYERNSVFESRGSPVPSELYDGLQTRGSIASTAHSHQELLPEEHN